MKVAVWENWINLILGIWVMLAPWVLPLPPEGARLGLVVSDSLAGAVIFVSSALALQELTVGEEVVSLVMGVWLFLSPWILGFSDDPTSLWSSLLVGLAVVLMASASLSLARGQSKRMQRP